MTGSGCGSSSGSEAPADGTRTASAAPALCSFSNPVAANLVAIAGEDHDHRRDARVGQLEL